MSDTGREVDMPGTEGRISELEDRVQALEDVLPHMQQLAYDAREGRFLERLERLEDMMGKLLDALARKEGRP